MRTTPEECAQLGKIIAQKLNGSKGPVTMLLPLKAISVISAPGRWGNFTTLAADTALFNALKSNLRPDVEVIEVNCAINDVPFAEACAKALLKNIQAAKQQP